MTKTRFALIVFALAIGTLAALRLRGQQNNSANPSPENGRYRFEQGEYGVAGAIGTTHGTFRFDTATGRTWEFVYFVDNNRNQRRLWVPVEEAAANNQ